MEFDIVVGGRFELIRVEDLNLASLPSRSYWRLACLSSVEDLHMHHVMFLWLPWIIVIGRSVEDKIPWFHFFLFQINGQSVVLVALIPAAYSEAEILS